ncbi:hypothetical protein A3F07_01455 [candidate division WWE3 bacterium RIFCSPHIGHO2_12_FULL_38_15]|uniref:Uncharacterized protein n=1 Tax=candidate division WWE3 bacterium RIFCSPHIGHO2_02_FULL_38_14 TaxID=1802620 RepID=A0A1F4V8S3_UNCKA|nr:MAG: hypothetical protein A2793_01840 [candidate division WWE3 bacterium RIFCSPHIGHO2_01_FULL_38_45]OGC48371.1 MAG: hypothetical protein A3F07_01455 [candidate division WWE3 bacterium RIFCSPHIGHO2_12_FULL_38_15]OGC53651.1 MAG: hypothetical protein A3D91_04395 [candidate division WWE3 bacterium RIFCSPHIGHO2_02_FULL_38_14]OGC54306.1 MAG: hypothetical protein A3B64_02255 [candidate division WWE3 bacterium RIFCSPLOWO2_01_FULL_37_24]HLB51551.1 hypothetical protein [Patescibacteria group bacterium
MDNNKSKDIRITLTTILLIVLIGTAVHFWQNYEKSKTSNTELLVQNTIEEDKFIENNVAGITSTSLDPAAAPESSQAESLDMASSSDVETEVVFVPSGLFTEEEKSDLNNKLIEPFLDFQKDSNILTLTLEIEKSSLEDAGYKYKISYINKGGSNGGMLFGLNSPLEWWLPDCLNGCIFSDSFKEKYPEIVEQSE